MNESQCSIIRIAVSLPRPGSKKYDVNNDDNDNNDNNDNSHHNKKKLIDSQIAMPEVKPTSVQWDTKQKDLAIKISEFYTGIGLSNRPFAMEHVHRVETLLRGPSAASATGVYMDGRRLEDAKV